MTAARGIVIGVGNPVRGDDAVGLAVARRARQRAYGELRVVELDGEPGRLIDAWEGADTAVVVDAASSGARPGSVRRIDARSERVPASLRATSSHALGVAEAIELARALDRLPGALTVYAIEGERFESGAPMSPTVEAAVGQVADRALADCGFSTAHRPSPADTVRRMERTYVGPELSRAHVSDAMRVGVITCRADTRLPDVAKMMVGYDAHSIVVDDDDDGGWGIVTSLDLARHSGELDDLTAGDVATTDLLTIASNAPLEEAAKLMADKGVSHLVAVQPDTGRPAGVISARGIAAVVAYGR